MDYSTQRTCLEFGSGDGSAEVFNRAANMYNIVIDSFEFNLMWYNKMKEKYSLHNYRFHYVNGYKNIPFEDLKKNYYDLIFLDHGKEPWGFASRIEVLQKLNSRIFALHNYDVYNRGVCADTLSIGSESFFSEYHSRFNLVRYIEDLPPTLVFITRVNL
jgi:hypothetical protein